MPDYEAHVKEVNVVEIETRKKTHHPDIAKIALDAFTDAFEATGGSMDSASDASPNVISIFRNRVARNDLKH